MHRNQFGLYSDVKDLQARVAGLTFPPEKVVGGAAALMEEVAATAAQGSTHVFVGHGIRRKE